MCYYGWSVSKFSVAKANVRQSICLSQKPISLSESCLSTISQSAYQPLFQSYHSAMKPPPSQPLRIITISNHCLSTFLPINYQDHHDNSAIMNPPFSHPPQPLSLDSQPSCQSAIIPIIHCAYQPSDLFLRLLSISACFFHRDWVPVLQKHIFHWYIKSWKLHKSTWSWRGYLGYRESIVGCYKQ